MMLYCKGDNWDRWVFKGYNVSESVCKNRYMKGYFLSIRIIVLKKKGTNFRLGLRTKENRHDRREWILVGVD
jgi:hypothetical protein